MSSTSSKVNLRILGCIVNQKPFSEWSVKTNTSLILLNMNYPYVIQYHKCFFQCFSLLKVPTTFCTNTIVFYGKHSLCYVYKPDSNFSLSHRTRQLGSLLEKIINSSIENVPGTCKNSFKVELTVSGLLRVFWNNKLVVGGKKVRTIIKTVQNALSESKPRNRECHRLGAYHLETKQNKTSIKYYRIRTGYLEKQEWVLDWNLGSLMLYLLRQID